MVRNREINARNINKKGYFNQHFLIRNDDKFFVKLNAIIALEYKDILNQFGMPNCVKLYSEKTSFWAWDLEGDTYLLCHSKRGTTVEATTEDKIKLRKAVEFWCDEFKEHPGFQIWLNFKLPKKRKITNLIKFLFT